MEAAGKGTPFEFYLHANSKSICKYLKLNQRVTGLITYLLAGAVVQDLGIER